MISAVLEIHLRSTIWLACVIIVIGLKKTKTFFTLSHAMTAKGGRQKKCTQLFRGRSDPLPPSAPLGDKGYLFHIYLTVVRLEGHDITEKLFI